MLSFIVFAVVVLVIAAIVVYGLRKIPQIGEFRGVIEAVIICGALIWVVWTAYQRFGR